MDSAVTRDIQALIAKKVSERFIRRRDGDALKESGEERKGAGERGERSCGGMTMTGHSGPRAIECHCRVERTRSGNRVSFLVTLR